MASPIIHGHTNRARVYAPEHPAANSQGQVYRYRLVAEAKIGRYLQPAEIVHHINGNPLDDRPENLEVIQRRNHGQEHSLAKQGKWSRLHSACRICATTSVRHHSLGLCKNCYPEVRNANRLAEFRTARALTRSQSVKPMSQMLPTAAIVPN